MLLCELYWEESTGTKTHRCWSPNRQLTRVVVFVIRYQHCGTISRSMAPSQVVPTSLCMGQTWILDPTYQSPWLARLARWSAKYTSKCWWGCPELIGDGLPNHCGSCHKYHFCCIKRCVMTNVCLSQQNMSFVVTKVCLLQQNFYRNKIMFVMTKYFWSWQNFLVTTNIILLWQKTCFVATNTGLSWQE